MNLLGATASDRSIILYDMRGSAPLRKVRVENLLDRAAAAQAVTENNRIQLIAGTKRTEKNGDIWRE